MDKTPALPPSDEPQLLGRMEVYSYPDGSQRVGCPPFPEKSPLEESTAEKRQMANGMVVPAGMATSGARPPPAGVHGLTEEEFRAKAQTQLDADLASGKTPEVVNPTTASDKPELAGTDGHVGELVNIGDNPTAEDLAAIAASIQPTGGQEATDEEKAAAVAQVDRETSGPIVSDEAPEKRKPGRPPTKK